MVEAHLETRVCESTTYVVWSLESRKNIPVNTYLWIYIEIVESIDVEGSSQRDSYALFLAQIKKL